MMDLLLATSGGESQSASGGYVDDVFSAYTYTGNGATQTINNGIDLAGNGGLVWTKTRGSTNNHALIDSARGFGVTAPILSSDLTSASSSIGTTSLSATSSGYTLGNSSGYVNGNGSTYISWTFRKAPKFFDVVTYTGNGVAGRQIAHSLGVQAGFVTVKATSTTGDWNSYHRSATGDLKLNLTDAQTASRAIITAADANSFTVSGAANTNGVSYVAYLWAHDPSAEGIIQCGSFTGNSTVNLGWEPQYLLIKNTASADDWYVLDTSRAFNVLGGSLNLYLLPNKANAEAVGVNVIPTSIGFAPNVGTGPFIYLAIRRPNKPPTSGTQVYNAIAYTGNGVTGRKFTGVGFPFDAFLCNNRQGISNNTLFDRLRGLQILSTTLTEPETAGAGDVASFDIDGWTTGNAGGNRTNYNARTYINHFFRRATGFMDVVCDTGTGVAHAIAHNLTKAPDLIIRKSRGAATQWEVWHSALAATEKLVLNSIAAKATDATAWGSTLPTATQFTVGTGANVNANAATFVTYLFATLAGISKVGSYTGNGSSQTINCGFSAGARFFLVKATSTTGNWWVFDSARGIVSSFDPSLALNSTAAEVTSADAVDPDPYGIIVNQEATCSINATGVNYVFLAIA